MLSIFGAAAWTGGRAWAKTATCAGDCDHDDRVTIDELVIAVNVGLGALPVDRCTALDSNGDGEVAVDELVAAVGRALAGCDAHGNRAPLASDVSFSADTATPYVQKQLIGADPDNDTITYELVSDAIGAGYSFAYVNPESGVLYVVLTPDFQGTIAFEYRVTDGKLFSPPAHATLEVQADTPSGSGGLQDVDPQTYASFPRGFYNGALLGAPGNEPTLPSSVDLSADFPLPGNQGNQNSCVGWSLGYAIRTYQERVEHGWSLEAPEHQFSPAYIYNQLNGGRDIGIVYSQALDLIVNQGVATIDQMPYNQFDFLTQPSAAARQEASLFKAKTWRAANGTLEVKAALANRLPVFMVIQLVSDILGLKGPDSVYNTFGGAFKGGHGVAAVGYDDNRYGGAFKIMNSWGQNFGDNGFFWMPYSSMNYIIATPDGPTAVLTGAVVIEDLPDPNIPDDDPVDPPPPAQLPDLQVTNWSAHYDGRPGGSGSLQYTVTNTGAATAPAGSYVALVLSHDPTFKSNNTLVVYESIPFAMAPGTTAYRDANNSIAFYFPQDLQPGEYYMALWTDIWNDVVESNENDNISPSTTTVEIVNTLPDMAVQSWYSRWDAFGNGALTYDIVNDGASTAPAGWLVSLVLSPNDTIGDGDEIFLFSEPANFAINPGGILYRDQSAPAAFSIIYDNSGNPVPPGTYYLALCVDPNQSLAESNEGNNASLSWGTVRITNGFDGSAAAVQRDASSTPAEESLDGGEGYNGKLLPSREAPVRTMQIRAARPGAAQSESLDDGDAGPRVKAAETHPWSKLARARQQVVFPVVEAKAMPSPN
jgi:hypothetical protein